MLKNLKSLLSQLIPAEEVPESRADLKQLAAAALMIEVATIDGSFDRRELAALSLELQQQFHLSGDVLERLIECARAESADATSLFQFTSCVNEEFSNQEKLDLLTGMWRVAYADGDLDKYEEHMIRRVADLIYVSHSQFILAKKMAKESSI